MKKTMYAALGALTWKLGKSYLRRRARAARGSLSP